MKNTALIALVLAFFVVAAVPAWGQATGLTNQSVDSKGGAGGLDPFGHRGHINRGCMLCHAPHTTGMSKADVGTSYNSTLVTYGTYDPLGTNGTAQGNSTTVNAVLNNGVWYAMDGVLTNGNSSGLLPVTDSKNATAPGIKLATAAQPLAGNYYLWLNPLSPITYKTYTGDTFSKGDVSSVQSPVLHSLLCLSCHDTANNSHDWANYGYPTSPTYADGTRGLTFVNGVAWNNSSLIYGIPVNGTRYAGTPPTPNDWGGNGTYGPNNQASFMAGEVGGIGRTRYDVGAGGWTGGSLMNSHPVHVKYPLSGQLANGQYAYWKVTINGRNVQFTDTAFPLTASFGAPTGHPARLYTDGTDAYVECTSCHNPHRLTSFAFPQNDGTWKVGPHNSTAFYIRGPFSAEEPTGESTGNNTPDGLMNSNFCRSCHYDKTQAWLDNVGAQSN